MNKIALISTIAGTTIVAGAVVVTTVYSKKKAEKIINDPELCPKYTDVIVDVMNFMDENRDTLFNDTDFTLYANALNQFHNICCEHRDLIGNLDSKLAYQLNRIMKIKSKKLKAFAIRSYCENINTTNFILPSCDGERREDIIDAVAEVNGTTYDVTDDTIVCDNN